MNRDNIKRRIGQVIEVTEFKYYLKKAKTNDSIRVHQAPIIQYRINGKLFDISIRLSQNGKSLQTYIIGLDYQKHLFDFELSEFKPKTVKEKVKVEANAAKKSNTAAKEKPNTATKPRKKRVVKKTPSTKK